MLQHILVALGISGVIFYFLQNVEETKARREGLPPPTVAKKAILFFFIFLMTLVIMHFLGLGVTGGKRSGGKVIDIGITGSSDASWKNEMIERIREDVHVGVAPF